jgi:hypothetical protein
MPSEGYGRLAPEGSLLAANALLLDAYSGHAHAATALRCDQQRRRPRAHDRDRGKAVVARRRRRRSSRHHCSRTVKDDTTTDAIVPLGSRRSETAAAGGSAHSRTNLARAGPDYGRVTTVMAIVCLWSRSPSSANAKS